MINLDIGFSEKNASCGLLFGGGNPSNVRFHEAKCGIVSAIAKSAGAVNLVIEAPLFVTLDKAGNPQVGVSKKAQNPTTIGSANDANLQALMLYLRSTDLKTSDPLLLVSAGR